MKYNPYTVSQVGQYNNCPRAFKYLKVDKIKRFKPSLATARGSYMHYLIENNFKYNNDYKTSEFLTNEVKQECNLIVKNFEENLGKKYKYIIDTNKSVVFEQRFSFDIDNNKLLPFKKYTDSAWFRGAIDFFYFENPNKIVCIDWKTGKDKSTDEEFGYLQALVYAVYLLTMYNVDEIETRFVFIEHNKESKPFRFLNKDLVKYIKELYNLTKKIENDSLFKPNVSELCNYCVFFEQECFEKENLENVSKKFQMSQGFDF